jgi:hypothetical protein
MVKKIYQLKEVFVQEKKKIQFLSETIFVLKCAVTVCMIKKKIVDRKYGVLWQDY